MTLKSKRAPVSFYFKLCASFHSHQWNQTGVTVRKHPIQVKINDFASCVTLKFDRWPRKTIGHLFYATSSFVHDFVAISEFEMELQSRNTQFGSKSTIFCAMWPLHLTDDLEEQQDTSPMPHQDLCIISSPYVNSNWSYSPDTVKLCFDLCDLWYLTLSFCMGITSAKDNKSLKFHDDIMVET